MSDEHDTKASESRRPTRKDYHPPTLLVYGALADLAAAGSGGVGENLVSKNKKKRP